MRLFLSAIFVGYCLFLPFFANAEFVRLSLPDAIKRGLSENRDISIAKERLIELEGLKAEALSSGLPQVSVNSGYSRAWKKQKVEIQGQIVTFGSFNTVTAGVGVSQLLWDGGRVLSAVRAARTEKAKGIENIRDAEQQVAYQIKETYYEILYTEKVIEVLKEQLKQLKGHLDAIKKRFKEGLESDFSLMRQNVEVSNIEPEIINAEKTRELLVNAMKIFLVIPQGDEFVPEGEFEYRSRVLPDIESLVEKAINRRPDLAAERLRARTLEQFVGMEKSGFWPNLNFTTNYESTLQADDFDFTQRKNSEAFSSAVNLTWTIFDGLKTSAKVKQARAKFYQQNLVATTKEDSVVKEVKDTHLAVLKSRESLATQQKTLELARKSSKIAGERFSAGLMSQLELNDTIEAQTKAEEFYLRAAFDCLISEAALETAVGGEL